MQFLKQSTGATVVIGPILDSAGAAVTGAVIGDLNITKNGTTAAMAGNTFIHSHNGHYLLTLTTTNTDTLGRLEVSANNAAHAMPMFRWTVLTAGMFDAIVTNGNVAKAGDAMALVTDAVNSAAVAASAVTEIQSGLATASELTALSNKVGTPDGASVSADIAAAKTVLDAVVVDTNELQTDWADGGRLDLLVDAALAAAVLARQILGNKHTVTNNGNGTYTIAVRNDADSATVRTIVYTPATGARTAS